MRASPPSGRIFFVTFRREERLHMPPDNLFKRRQTDALMGDVNPSPVTGRYFEKLFGIYFGGYSVHNECT